MSKIVSVIIPVYNAEKTLKRCVDSIIQQNYEELQVLLVDDGSTDGSPKICDDYATADKRIQVIHRENGGVCAARNTGLDNATGAYITFADNDDFIMQGMYRKMVSKMEESELDVCISHFLNGSVESNVPSVPNAPKLKEGIYDSYEIERLMFLPNWYQSSMICSVWNKLYKREIVQNIRFSETWAEDYAFNDIVNSKHLRVGIIDEAYYSWCYNQRSQSHQTYRPFWNSLLSVISKRAELFSDDRDISNRSKEMFCNQYIEYRIISKIKGYDFPFIYDSTFKKYTLELKQNGACSLKWYTRMKIFQLSPYIYYLLTRKTWKKYWTVDN